MEEWVCWVSRRNRVKDIDGKMAGHNFWHQRFQVLSLHGGSREELLSLRKNRPQYPLLNVKGNKNGQRSEMFNLEAVWKELELARR